MFASFAANAYNMQGNQGVIHSIHMVHMGCCSVGQYLAAYNPNALQSYLSAEQFAQEIRALNAIWAKHLSQAKSVGIAAIVGIVLGFVTFAMTGVVIASADMGFPITVPIGMVIFITGMGLAAFSNVSRRNACARAFIEIQTYCGQKSGAYNGLQWNVQQNMMVIGRRQAQMVPVINLVRVGHGSEGVREGGEGGDGGERGAVGTLGGRGIRLAW